MRLAVGGEHEALVEKCPGPKVAGGVSAADVAGVVAEVAEEQEYRGTHKGKGGSGKSSGGGKQKDVTAEQTPCHGCGKLNYLLAQRWNLHVNLAPN